MLGILHKFCSKMGHFLVKRQFVRHRVEKP